MFMYFATGLLLFVGLNAIPENSYAEDTIRKVEYMVSSIEQRAFDDSAYAKATDGIEYPGETEKKKKKKEKKTSSSFSFDWNNVGPVAKFALYAIVIAGLIFILVRVFYSSLFISNTKIENKPAYAAKNLEEKVMETDLEKLLKAALAEKAYRMAVRIYYLMVIKELAHKKMIKWKKDKTNHDYLSEMKNQNKYMRFRQLTRVFDYVWYGEIELTEDEFGEIKPEFTLFIDALKPVIKEKISEDF